MRQPTNQDAWGGSSARRAIAGATIVMAAALWGSMRVVINSYSVLETFSESHPAVQTLRLVERQLAGIMPLEISLEAGEEGAFLEPDVFHNVLAIEREAREFDGVLAVRSYADLLRAVLVHWPGRRLSETD